MKRTAQHSITLTKFPVFTVGFLLALLEACTVFFVTFVRIPSQWNALTLVLAVITGLIGGFFFLSLVQVALKRRRFLSIQDVPVRSISYGAPLWLITLFLIISFAVQDLILPLIENRLITLGIVSIITAGSLGCVSLLYSAIPFRRWTRPMLLRMKTDNQYTFIIQRWSFGTLIAAALGFEFLFLLLLEYLLPLLSSVLPEYGSVPLAAGVSGFLSGIVVTQIVNLILQKSRHRLTVDILSEKHSS